MAKPQELDILFQDEQVCKSFFVIDVYLPKKEVWEVAFCPPSSPRGSKLIPTLNPVYLYETVQRQMNTYSTYWLYVVVRNW